MSEGDSKRTSGETTGQSKSSGSGGGEDAMHPSTEEDRGGYDSEKARTSDLLCSACDRCRAKKTKCDGERPCDACKTFYMRENKLKNMDSVDLTAVSCSYSPAKKRGPPPARNKSSTKSSSSSGNNDVKEKKKHKKRRHEGEQVHASQPQVPQLPPEGMPPAAGDSTAVLLNSGTMQPAGGLQQAAGNPLLFPPLVSNPLLPHQPPQQLAFGGSAGPTQQQPLTALQQLIQLVSVQQAQQQQQQQQQLQQQLIQQLQQQVQQQVQQFQQQPEQPQPIPAQQLQQESSSSLSSSAEAEGEKSLRIEVDQLKKRMRRLETENERLKERIELLHAKQSLEDKEEEED
jgi:hypothetical protein